MEFYCSSINVLIKALSGYAVVRIVLSLFSHRNNLVKKNCASLLALDKQKGDHCQ